MASSSESPEPKQSNPEPPNDVQKPDETELPQYKYKRLEHRDHLRLLRLRPANENQVDIDCEILEIALPEDVDDESEDKQDEGNNSSMSENHPDMTSKEGMLQHLEELEKSDDESTAHTSNDDKKDATTSEQAEAKEKKEAQKKRRKYEAVSWCWGKEPYSETLRVHEGDKVFAFPISPNLRSALWALRKPNEVRQLWVDALCIDQKNKEERNQQVPRMDKIYGSARNVCIWLGNATEDSKKAMEFIKNRVLQLWKFDELIENKDMAKHWAALITLMKRPWFSRRWVVQEIALSPRGGTIHCGKDYNTWQDFADAVSLFVEVETATHRLSDVMKLDQTFGNIPDFFGNVSSLGAALLVDATSNLFRNQNRNLQTQERKPLSSLEFLVSRLSVFEATQPRDTVYALLAISRDTTPEASDRDPDPNVQARMEMMRTTMKALTPKGGFGNQNYYVDYRLPVIDVYQQFIAFSLFESDKKRALDIICRPWAPTVSKRHDYPDFLSPAFTPVEEKPKKKSKDKKKEEEEEKRLEAEKKKMDDEKDEETPLPSWIPSLTRAAFEMEEHPTAGLRMERQNADPLVGLPDDSGRRNYSAAGDRGLDLEDLKFIKWDTLRKPNSSYPDYSMFVRGFIFDEVLAVDHLASNGNIPYKWLHVGGWRDTEEYPPEEFWRTLVADRAHGGHNPPTYFPRACKESMRYKAKTMSKTGGNLDCRKLIYEGRCTIVAEFLRRVQEVIWNRKLMTTKGGRLGLVRDDVSQGFMVCILYGCSVPVILEKLPKTEKELSAELHDRYYQWYAGFERLASLCQARYKMRKGRRLEMEAKERQAKEFHKSKVASLQAQRRPSWPLNTAQTPNNYPDLAHFQKVWSSQRDEAIKSRNKASGMTGNSPGQTTTPVNNLPPSVSPSSNMTDSSTGTRFTAGSSSEDSNKASGSQHQDSGANNISPNSETQLKKQVTFRPPERTKSQLELREEGKMYHDERKRMKKKEIADLVFASPCYYRLVGECYVHGMMNGEAIALQNRDRIGMPDQIFELR